MSEHARGGPPNADQKADWPGAIGAIVFAGLGIWIVLQGLAMSPLAAKFPLTVGAVMTGLALVQLALSLAGQAQGDLEAGIPADNHSKASLARQLSLVVVMLGWALLFPWLGMFVTSLAACLMLAMIAQFGPISWTRAAVYLVTLVIAVSAFYQLMTRILNIPMPPSLLF